METTQRGWHLLGERARYGDVPLSFIGALERTRHTHGHLDVALNINGEWDSTSGNTYTITGKSVGLADELGMEGRRVQ